MDITRKADGFRTEKCARCGEAIGYAHFEARTYQVPVDGEWTTEVVFTHRDQATYEFPTWCQPKKVSA